MEYVLGISSETALLISPLSHSFAMSRMRALLIISRVQQIARFFAFMTICWILVDALSLPWLLWSKLALERFVASGAFLLLSLLDFKMRPSLGRALLLLLTLFVIVLTFLFFATCLLYVNTGANSYMQFTTIYYFSPFVLAAGIGFFPLTLAEVVLVLVFPITMAMSFYIWMFKGAISGEVGYQRMFIFLFFLGTSAMASISQLGFLFQLFKDTAYDKLTGLFLRKTGEVTLAQQIAGAVRYHYDYAVLLLDLDNFKAINDRFGHGAGDHVLGVVGQQLAHALRQQDMAVRWGGEEFLIALPNTNKTQAEIFVKRFVAAGLGMSQNGEPITASFGIAEIKADQMKDLPTLIALADKRLYVAKEAGRNCYVLQDAAIRF